jgi:hypothetical protein
VVILRIESVSIVGRKKSLRLEKIPQLCGVESQSLVARGEMPNLILTVIAKPQRSTG